MVLADGSSFGSYRILGRLGSGGMASVYHAFQANPQREVALKVISPELAHDPVFRARFRREANMLARLEHPNILPIFESGEVAAQPYICYRYMRGGTLKELLTGPLPVTQVAAFLAPVAGALDFAHRSGVIHRDIKPANILLSLPDSDGIRTPMVADFGIARLLEQALPQHEGAENLFDTNLSLSHAGAGLGTPAYMAPEQVLGRPLDGQADQYALGITAYQMLAGTVPFSATTPQELAFMHVSEPLPLPSSRNPSIMPAAEQALLRALARNPANRFPSCSAFIGALAAAGAAGAAETVPTPWLPGRSGDTLHNRRSKPEPEPGLRSRPGRLAGAIGGLGLIVLLGAVLVVLLTKNHQGNSHVRVTSPTVVTGGAPTVAASPAQTPRPRDNSGATGTGTAAGTATASPRAGVIVETVLPTAPAAAARPTVAPPTPALTSSAPPPPSTATAYLGLRVSDLIFGKGVNVDAVAPGSPAEAAGVLAGDTVTAVDGTTLVTPDDLTAVVAKKHPGDVVSLSINRSGVNMTLRATLAAR